MQNSPEGRQPDPPTPHIWLLRIIQNLNFQSELALHCISQYIEIQYSPGGGPQIP